MQNSKRLPSNVANVLSTVLAYLVQREGGMVLVPNLNRVGDAVRGWRLKLDRDEERDQTIVTLVPKEDKSCQQK